MTSEFSDTQRHWATKYPINEKLRAIIEPLTHHFAEEMQGELERLSPDGRAEMLEETGNVYELPYGRMSMLPPALFGTISEDAIILEKTLVVPKSDEEIGVLADRYADWMQGVVDSKRYNRVWVPTKEASAEFMTTRKGVKYPHKDWLTSARATQQALKNGTDFIMELHWNHRMTNNTVLSYDQLKPATREIYGGYSSYALVMSGRFSGESGNYGYDAFRDLAQLPITEYGAEAAGKLARMTAALNDFVKTSPMIDQGIRTRFSSEDESLLVQHTARSRARYKDSVEDAAVHGVKNTLAEGILTMTQVISFLTAEKIEGYDDYDELVTAILDSDVIEQFTRIVRPGFIGPVTLSGLYLPGALVGDNGRLTLSKEVVAMLNEERRQHIQATIAQWALHESGEGEMPVALGVTCPAAAPKGAITELKGVMRAFYKSDLES